MLLQLNFWPLALTTFLCSCGKSEAAQAVDDMVPSLEAVDETSGPTIVEVESAYGATGNQHY